MAPPLGKHHSMDSATTRSVEWISGLRGVKKINLGESRYQPHSRTHGSVAVKNIKGNSIQLTVYGDNDLREIHVVTEDPLPVIEKVYERWPTAQGSNERVRTQMNVALGKSNGTQGPVSEEIAAVFAPRVITTPVVVPAPDTSAGLPDILSTLKQVSTPVQSIMVEITPELAYEWLSSRNKVNRKLKPRFVRRMIRVLKSGGWDPHAGVIHFDVFGNLINGQNRLTAIFEAGVTVYARVDLNVPIETAGNLDTLQTTRTDVDIARILHQDHDLTPLHFATAVRVWFRGRRRPTSDGVGDELSPNERQQVMAKLRPHVDFAIGTARRSRKFILSATFAVVARASMDPKIDRAKIEEFMTILRTGMSTTEAHQPIIALRNHLQTQVMRKTGSSRLETAELDLYRKSARALRAFLDGQVLTRLYATEQELFPVAKGFEADECVD